MIGRRKNHLRFSISTYTLFSHPIDKAIKTLIDHEWKAIEIMGEGKNHGRKLLHMNKHQLTELAKLGKEQDVSFGYHLPIEGFNPASADDETNKLWDSCKKIIDVFDMKYILFHLGANPSIDEGIDSAAAFIKKMLLDLPNHIHVLIENVPHVAHHIGSSMKQLISIIEKVNDSRLKIMLDTGHCYMSEKQHFLTECQKTFPYLYGLHINDNHGDTDEHLQIGEGTIPFQQLFDTLPYFNLLMVLETNTTQRAEHSKEKIKQLVKNKVTSKDL